MEQNILSRTISAKNKQVKVTLEINIVMIKGKMEKVPRGIRGEKPSNYLSTCVPTHKVIQNKNKYIAHNSINMSLMQL